MHLSFKNWFSTTEPILFLRWCCLLCIYVCKARKRYLWRK